MLFSTKSTLLKRCIPSIKPKKGFAKEYPKDSNFKAFKHIEFQKHRQNIYESIKVPKLKRDHEKIRGLMDSLEKKFPYSIDTFNVILNANVLLGSQEGISKALGTLTSKGLKYSLTTFNIMISWFKEQGQVEKAQMIFEKIKNNGLLPDTTTYTLMITLHAKSDLTKSIYFWNEFLKCKHKPKIDIFICNAIMMAYAEHEKFENVQNVLQIASQNRIKINKITHKIVIKALIKHGRYKEAMCEFDEKLCSFPILDSDRYEIAKSFASKGRVDSIVRVLLGIKANLEEYFALLSIIMNQSVNSNGNACKFFNLFIKPLDFDVDGREVDKQFMGKIMAMANKKRNSPLLTLIASKKL